MAGTGPKLPESPLELLTTRFSDEPVTNKFFTPMSFGAVCLAASVLGNYFTKRPLFSGIQRHVGITAIGVYAGVAGDKWRNEYYADRDAMYKHYVELHPEDFPPYERKKFGDVLDRWQPAR